MPPLTEWKPDVLVAAGHSMGLERFRSYVDSGLVALSDLRPFYDDWAATLRCPKVPRRKEHRPTRLAAYMNHCGYAGALDLLREIAGSERRA